MISSEMESMMSSEIYLLLLVFGNKYQARKSRWV